MTYVDADTASSLNLTYASSTRAVLRVDTSDAEDTTTDTSSASSSTETTTSTPSTSNTNQGGQTNSQQGSTSSTNTHQQGGPGKRQSTTTTSSSGRNSVRVTSKNTYDTGLFIFDVYHTPHGCGTWPALWLTDVDNWPTNGEIDVMEAVNLAATGNQMTLHTADDCKMNHKRKETGTALYKNCYAYANDESGCGVTGNDSTFGEAYNDLGGGIMALEWRSAGIRVWNFLRDGVPADIAGGSPDPSSWGEATADFPNTGCDIDSHFSNQTIIINISLCGSWAGGTAYTESTCEFATFLSLHEYMFANFGERPEQLYGLCCEQSVELHRCVLGIWIVPGVPPLKLYYLSYHDTLHTYVHILSSNNARRLYTSTESGTLSV